MNWGKGLALSLIGFAAMMAAFGIASARRTETLVTERYYEQELKYQDRIDASARAHAVGGVRIEVMRDAVLIRFPEAMSGRAITGDLLLQRPNDPGADRTIDITRTEEGLFSASGLVLLPGRYNAQLQWSADGVAYYTEDKLVVQ